MRRMLLLATVTTITVLGLAGCGAPMGASDIAHPPAGSVSPEMAPSQDSGGFGADERQADGAQHFVTTGRMTVSVEAPTDAADEATRIVESVGGHVSARTDRRPSDSDPGRSDLTLRIPAAQLTTVLDRLEELGETVQRSHESVEVTMQVRDLDARISALEAAIDRLLALMVEADSTEDLIAIESALTQRQVELEQYSSQRRHVADQVALSTIGLALIAPEEAPPVDPESFWSGLITGWNAFVAFWASVLVALGVMTPWIVLLALVVLVIALVIRSAVRRSRSGAAAPVEAPAASAEAQDSPPASTPSAE